MNIKPLEPEKLAAMLLVAAGVPKEYADTGIAYEFLMTAINLLKVARIYIQEETSSDASFYNLTTREEDIGPRMSDIHAVQALGNPSLTIGVGDTAYNQINYPIDKIELQVLRDVFRDADRWRALMRSKRLQVNSTHGFDPSKRTTPEDYRHCMMQFWTHWQDDYHVENKVASLFARRVLSAFADQIIENEQREKANAGHTQATHNVEQGVVASA